VAKRVKESVMNRVTLFSGNHTTAAIVFLCMLALALCQILGPTARLNTSFSPAGPAEQAFAVATINVSGAHNPLPARCASIKLAPIEITTADFAPTGVTCGLVTALTSTLPQSAEPGVPTPPPRRV
jgi:hypothetical protein